MKKELLRRYRIDKLDDNTVFITSRVFNFSYTVANSIVRDEYKNQYRYFGGLQCDFEEGTQDYKLLEGWLCEIAETTLGINYGRDGK